MDSNQSSLPGEKACADHCATSTLDSIILRPGTRTVPRAGLEPATLGLKVRCSTTELRRRRCLEGFEPPSMSLGETSATTAPQTLNVIRQACFYLQPRLEHTSCEESNPTFFNCKSKVILLLNPVLELVHYFKSWTKDNHLILFICLINFIIDN